MISFRNLSRRSKKKKSTTMKSEELQIQTPPMNELLELKKMPKGSKIN